MLGVDHVDLKPAMLVTEGDKVKLGQALFEHKKLPGVRITAPGAGKVRAIHRGAQRLLQSVVIRLDDTEDEETFAAYPVDQLASLTDAQVVDNLLASGLWVALRTRPYSKIADPTTRPAAIFVTAMDSNPLAADPVPIITAEAESFGHGLTVLSRLGTMPLWVCKSPAAELPLPQGIEPRTPGEFRRPPPSRSAGDAHSFSRTGRRQQGCLAPQLPRGDCDRQAVYQRPLINRTHRRARRTSSQTATPAADQARRLYRGIDRG